MAGKSEARIQFEIFERYGADPRMRIWRSNSGKARGATGQMVTYNFPGCPDLTGWVKLPNGAAAFLGIEVKSATGKQTEQQKDFQALCIRWGALYILARSTDDVELGLTQYLSRFS